MVGAEGVVVGVSVVVIVIVIIIEGRATRSDGGGKEDDGEAGQFFSSVEAAFGEPGQDGRSVGWGVEFESVRRADFGGVGAGAVGEVKGECGRDRGGACGNGAVLVVVGGRRGKEVVCLAGVDLIKGVSPDELELAQDNVFYLLAVAVVEGVGAISANGLEGEG